ncbi:hypothetical protein [Teredinibacter sp. KSP-S5-2]|uniref:hypothetical protein n=1 Tax=Teredinibacter sp. KSP-S5-2 TaxID=3034506 RepID=UPI00293533B3|nr:hypothetical protein [Teredinibacter sp. KSP-S5-2]WNO10059.1 hypothetical protein P5V12_02625 [Teredinibacter sp. KSP-S5-2]
MKLLRLLILLVISSSACAENFDARVFFAEAAMQSEEGKKYEKLVRESTWDVDGECFHASAKIRATPGYYQLVATIDRDGKAKMVEVRPVHHYSSCVAIWFANNRFPKPPRDNWPIRLEVDSQP